MTPKTPPPSPPNTSPPKIWAVGGGKGGTGKSFMASNLGVLLANQGKKVILLDADLGGANLHSFLGISRPKYSLTAFLDKEKDLQRIPVPTAIPHLQLVAGDLGSLTPYAIPTVYKNKLFRHILKFDADYVIVDLGAGSQLFTIDTFIFADRMIAVIIPEVIAIENLYIFIKKAMFRKINLLLRERNLKEAAREAWQNRKKHKIETLSDYISFLKGVSKPIRSAIEEELSRFKVHLVLNQVRDTAQKDIGPQIKSVLLKHFGIPAEFVGHITFNNMYKQQALRTSSVINIQSTTTIADEISPIITKLTARMK